MTDIHDIARRAKVSIATVSRTTNGKASVRSALAKRVWRAIEDLGYAPNTQARALVSGKCRMYGLIVPALGHPFFSAVAQGFQTMAEMRGYQVIVSGAGYSPERVGEATRKMICRRVDGLAVFGVQAPEIVADELMRAKMATVVADGEVAATCTRTVRIDYLQGVRQAVQHLAAMRHKRIGFVMGPDHSPSSSARKQAFEQSMAEIELPVEARLTIAGDDSIESGKEAMRRMANLAPAPTAVVCCNDLTAIGLLQEASRRGIRVPQDVSVVGIEDLWLSRTAIPALSTVQVSQEKLAEQAFASLHEEEDNGESRGSGGDRRLATELVLRASTGIHVAAAESA